MEVKLEYYTDPALLGKYAAKCYGREGNNEKRLAHIVKVGHLSVLRFGHATFDITGISRVALAQLTRSKHLDYLVRSSRYCDESEAEYFEPYGLNVAPLALQRDWEHAVEQAQSIYRMAINAGMKKEDARYILPQSQETSLYVTGNYQAWVDFIKLRTSKAAQKEVREVALEVQKQLKHVAPVIFDAQL